MNEKNRLPRVYETKTTLPAAGVIAVRARKKVIDF